MYSEISLWRDVSQTSNYGVRVLDKYFIKAQKKKKKKNLHENLFVESHKQAKQHSFS